MGERDRGDDIFGEDDIFEKNLFDNISDDNENSDVDLQKESKVSSIGDYWNHNTEKAIIDFLFLDERFYDNRIEEEKNAALKEGRKINNDFCREMEKRKQDVMEISGRKEQREKIFREHIKQPLQKLVESILFNYRLFVPNIDIKTQQRDCYSFLYTKFTKFNPWNGTKSYSYYGTIAKHFYLGKRKEFSNAKNNVVDFDLYKTQLDNKLFDDSMVSEKKDNSLELFNFVVKTIENEIDNDNMSKNDRKVGDAIVQIFKNHQIIGVYNKNQVYQLIKERTGLDTKDITYSLHRFRINYKTIKQKFIKKQKESE